MGLIREILTRKEKCRIKATIPYMEKTQKLLKEAVEEVSETSEQLYKAEQWKRKNSIQIRKLAAKLIRGLKRLDVASGMYFKIDAVRTDYGEEEKLYLEELQKYWHSIKLSNLPTSQWGLIAKTMIKHNLKNAKVLVQLGDISLSSGLLEEQSKS